ncbi:MAG: type I-E CRISPR-associated protein Cas7/Cse4/CasC, partial [Bowdeniella nasicola]|nr:type I-E CRISPR-associated protein Cas7/Cse4/CasC [Bowdeniella nasicola]
MHNKFVDIHVLQSVPPSCINRDENGSPKTAIYGGVSRLRVSSQAWKRAVRETFTVNLSSEESAQRTVHIVDLVTAAIIERDASLADRAPELAEAVVTATGVKVKLDKNGQLKVTGYLLFLSNAQVGLLADEAVAAAHEDRAIDKKVAKAALRGENSIDLALFGRMVADWPDANVDAACQVAHAISTHNAAHEFDFFTAVDDVKSQSEDADAGAGMMGTVEFSSATLYRYASINVDALVDNLGTRSVAQTAISEFVRAFITSMPSGKVNTFANHTLPS